MVPAADAVDAAVLLHAVVVDPGEARQVGQNVTGEVRERSGAAQVADGDFPVVAAPSAVGLTPNAIEGGAGELRGAGLGLDPKPRLRAPGTEAPVPVVCFCIRDRVEEMAVVVNTQFFIGPFARPLVEENGAQLHHSLSGLTHPGLG